MSELDPSPQPPRRPVLYMPPPPPVELKPIPSWAWVGGALLVVVLIGGSIFFVRWLRAQSHATDSAVASLHQKMTAADAAAIYADADPTYQQTVTQKGSNALFSSVRTRLGIPRSATQIDSRYTDDPTMGTFLTLHYRTTFDNGQGRETMCFHKNNGVWKLAAYNVESPMLRPNKLIARVKTP